MNANNNNPINDYHKYTGELAGGNLTGPLNKNFGDFEDEDCNLADEDENLDEDDFLNESSQAKFCNDSYNSYNNMPNGNDRLSSHYQRSMYQNHMDQKSDFN